MSEPQAICPASRMELRMWKYCKGKMTSFTPWKAAQPFASSKCYLYIFNICNASAIVSILIFHTFLILLTPGLASKLKMHSLRIIVIAVWANFVAAAPFSYPLANGFPKINTTTLEGIFKLAGGTIPNVSPPTTLTASGVQTLQLIAANVLFEIAYFTELIHNITSGVPEYRVDQYILILLQLL
jgi:hypothetical protein